MRPTSSTGRDSLPLTPSLSAGKSSSLPCSPGITNDAVTIDGAIEASALWPLVAVLGDIAARVCRQPAEKHVGNDGIVATEDAAA
jgi:hypothetical protein